MNAKTETRTKKRNASVRLNDPNDAPAMGGAVQAGNPQRWETKEGSPRPLGPTWITEEQAYNFAIYSKYATSVTLLLFGPEDFVSPVLQYRFAPFRNKTGRVWHARIAKAEMGSAKRRNWTSKNS
jgi:pullulanase/glycogen debranching enzyme